jgi:hypothetical protein
MSPRPAGALFSGIHTKIALCGIASRTTRRRFEAWLHVGKSAQADLPMERTLINF